MSSRPEVTPEDVLAWAASGAMALTGRASGPPRVAPTSAARVVRTTLEALGVSIPGLLGERAAYAGFRRNGPWSCGGSFRVLPSLDGWVGVSLPRESDVALLPALIEGEVRDPWRDLATWLARSSSADAEARLHVLGLAGGAVPTRAQAGGRRPGVLTTALGVRKPVDAPLVVDLTSLWAGPLCAHILGLRGAEVVKVESSTRPDAARIGTPAYFDLLHSGHRSLTLDFATEGEVLRDLVASADLVLEASRPRALRHFGIRAEEIVARGTSWLSITARGRDSNTIGFGDDVAACAGAVVRDDDDLLPVGDALADPVSGVAAAAAAVEALKSGASVLVDVSMVDVVAETVGQVPVHEATRHGHEWWVETTTGRQRVREPWRR
jgi:crotonobetainyl-CoA:carnitine CoA-transferase CaiB-like acyl-CoA transferase